VLVRIFSSGMRNFAMVRARASEIDNERAAQDRTDVRLLTKGALSRRLPGGARQFSTVLHRREPDGSPRR